MSRRWKIGLSIVVAGFVFFVAATVFAAMEASRHAREWAVDWLSQRYNSQVELGAFHVSVYPRIRLTGENLALHFEGRGDLPPLIAAKSFVVEANPLELLRNPRRISMVRMEGLAINIPPRQQSENQAGTGIKWYKDIRNIRDASFAEIISDNVMLTILTTNPARRPLEFDIEHLTLHSTSKDGQLAFRATLTNPTPPGDIFSVGTVGPWDPNTPSLTPVSGTYTFDNADLGVFQGISGTLSAKGNYSGALDRIETDGATDTPDFRVMRSGHAVDLKTSYHAIVDGTDGNTYLQPVEAHFLKTTLVARGKVEGVKGEPGKTITLDVTAGQARIEDLLQLTVDQPAAMTGPVQLKTKMVLPPGAHGAQTILDRLMLQGSFVLPAAHFTNGSLQQKFDNLSKRSLGEPHELRNPSEPDPNDDVVSDMKGNFAVKNGVMTFGSLAFQVPGAQITLAGTYGMSQELLDLHGQLAMQAKLSQTTTGIKSFLLRAVNPFFSKDGKGTVLPIKIVGPVKQPSYGLDFHRKESSSISQR